MTKIEGYMCDVCMTDSLDVYRDVTEWENLNIWLLAEPDGPAEHLCNKCYWELKEVIEKWVASKHD